MESNNTTPQAIGQRIASLRQKKGLTQTELGNMIHQRRETVSYWENGSRDIKSGDIVLLADALETNCDYILRGIQPNNIDIYKATGLSNEAIEYLQRNFPPVNPELNDLLMSTYADEFFYYIDDIKTKAKRRKQISDTYVMLYDQNPQFAPENPQVIAEYEKWNVANDAFDLVLFRLTNVIRDIAKEIGDKACKEVE